MSRLTLRNKKGRKGQSEEDNVRSDCDALNQATFDR